MIMAPRVSATCRRKGCGAVTENDDEMECDRGIPQDVAAPIDKGINVERGQSRLLFVCLFCQLGQSPSGQL